MATTRKPTKTTRSAKTTPEVEQPKAVAADVTLDLDTLEREGAKPPFTFRHNGKRYLLADPQELDWQDLFAALGNPVLFVQKIVPADDHDEFFATRMPTWKINALFENYIEHYGLPKPGEAPGLPR